MARRFSAKSKGYMLTYAFKKRKKKTIQVRSIGIMIQMKKIIKYTEGIETLTALMENSSKKS